VLPSRARCSRLSERYPAWFLIALVIVIGVSRFVATSWGAWAILALLFVYVAAIFSHVANASWVRGSIQSYVETSVIDAAMRPDIFRRRCAWARNVTLSMALFIMVLAVAFDALAKI